jgi:anti-sigma regulatory factor (Ser/Thr protein kinase)
MRGRLKDYSPGARPSSAPETLVEQIAHLCANAIGELCAVYRAAGELPVAFTARDSARYESLSWAAYDDLYAERVYALGLDRLVREPLISGNETIGVLVVAGTADAPPPEHLVKMAAAIVAGSIAQQERLAHHTHLSDRLQRAMLPRRLVHLDRGSLDAAYSPASRESDVGGDWYDAFDLADGKVGVSIGDETGHGLEAAVAMSEIRHALRSAAATLTNTSDILNTVDSIVASREIGMASAIFGIYDRATHVLRYSSAGHPPPVFVTAAGNAYALEAGGALLGLGLCEASPECTVTLTPGTTCVLYTDGLIEYARDFIAGEQNFIATLEALAACGQLAAQELHGKIVSGGPLDDCATLLIRRDDTSDAGVERYLYSATPSSARLARDAIAHYARRCGLDESETFGLITATGEAVANAIEHGEHDDGEAFSVDIARKDSCLCVDVESVGHWRASTETELRGRGLSLMRACATSLRVASNSERTRISMEFYATA